MEGTIRKKIVLAGLILMVPAMLMLALPIMPAVEMPLILLFIGRFHPMFLHFPIVLIFMALVFEVLIGTKIVKLSSTVIQVILIAASLTSLAVVLAGFFLYTSGDYSGETMTAHFRGGIFSGFGILITTFFFHLDQWIGHPFRRLYFGFLLLTNIIVTYTSHVGGSLTHGQNYLTEYIAELFESNSQPLKPKSEMIIYDDLIVPFIETKCMSCHNEHKKKGDYLMTSYASLVKGGESGAQAVVSGNLTDSELLKRVLLPLNHDDHMPPEGKKPLNEYEIDLLKFWIAEGAPTDMIVSHIENDTINRVIDLYLPESARMSRRLVQSKEEKKKLIVELQAIGEKLQVSIVEDLDSEGNLFALSMQFPPWPFFDEQLQELQPYYDLFSKVSLVASDVTDDGLYFIGKMTNLRELYIQKTTIDGSGLIYLKDLPFLERLNLSYTKMNDASVLQLITHPGLKEVYLHNNGISPEVIEALRENQADKKFLLEEGPYN
ncbi:MAG: cytochrome C [Cyclobacteriaceae bacterium]|nr:cytochrome C [Cyclobacteriaceae bacterium]